MCLICLGNCRGTAAKLTNLDPDPSQNRREELPHPTVRIPTENCNVSVLIKYLIMN